MAKTQLIKQYLEALAIDRKLPPKALVNQMIERHLSHFSFNNIDLLLNDCAILSLELTDIFTKIVDSKRGGYCFEHNKLFFYMLKQLQFDATPCLARVTYNRDREVSESHRLSIVRIEGQDYVADVGFGANTPNMLIGFNGDAQTTPNGKTYKLEKLDENIYALNILKAEGFIELYQMNISARLEIDFDVANYYTNTHPDSNFINDLSAAVNFEDLTLFIKNNIFTTINRETRRDEPIPSAEQLRTIIERHFFIELNAQQALKLYELI